MSDHSITSLIEKLEGAKIGSRELDCEIYEGQNPTHKPVKGQKGRYYDPEIISALGAEKYITHGTYVAPQYSNSLDAALALAERTGWRAYAIDGSIIRQTSVMLQSLDDRPGTNAETGAHMIGKDYSRATAKTPALAICAAVLRAQSEARV